MLNVFLVSMGCAKNGVDSERLASLLAASGHKIVESADDAQVGLINTCGFIQGAVKENVDAILDLELLKEQGVLEKIVVAGCLVNRYEMELRLELPSVDLWARAEEWDKIADFLGQRVASNCRALLPEGRAWSRYLKVGEGCDACCSYCTIPMIRGRLRSVPIPRLADEARELCAAGARELCLVGQDLTAYGQDLYGEPAVEKLLTALNETVPVGTWIRLLYLHPSRVTGKFLDFLLKMRKVLPYLDVPIQHIDETILAAMNRSADAAHIREVFASARARDPLFALRTTVMVGFPGETEEQFQRLLDFLEEFQIDRVGAFVYSPEEGTKAALLPDQVPDEVKEERRGRLMEFQASISRERNALFMGRTLSILVEEADAENGLALGRSYRDAPEVDGMVCVDNGAGLVPGTFVDVRVSDFAEHDLFGSAVLRKKTRTIKGFVL
ncbi:MAG: 30S ribosomal protein S12 methylthiotransferase RimO [Synergistaceae bacterium]|nr:30S ribosomal protein S12 methylthiotransferase RimO [Synergistaceae bacterium]